MTRYLRRPSHIPGNSALSAMVPVALLLVSSCSSSSDSGTSSSSTTSTSSGSTRASSRGSSQSSGATSSTTTSSSSGSGPGDAGDSGTPGGGDAGLIRGDVCGAASGTVAWTGRIAPASSSLAISDIAVSTLASTAAGTNDVVVADLSGPATYEQHRWDKTGTLLGVHQDTLGAYTGTFFPSALFMAADNGLFYGMLMTGMVSGANSQASLVFTKLLSSGTPVFQTPTTKMLPTSSGAPVVTMFDTGGDMGGGLHGPLVMSGPQYFAPGVYCWGSTGADEGPSAGPVTTMMTGHSFEWPMPSGNLSIATAVIADINLGCGTVTVPAAGGIVLAQAGGGSGCNWNKLLALPTAAVSAFDFRLGADGSSAFAVVYSGTINFGGDSYTSTGTSSLAVANFSDTGTLLWANSFGGAGSSFKLGDVRVNNTGSLMVSAGYSGTVDLGGGPLPSTDNTLVAVFDSTGALSWSKTVTVSGSGVLRAAIGARGVVVATNSPSVNFGTGPLSTVQAGMPASIGVAALGL